MLSYILHLEGRTVLASQLLRPYNGQCWRFQIRAHIVFGQLPDGRWRKQQDSTAALVMEAARHLAQKETW